MSADTRTAETTATPPGKFETLAEARKALALFKPPVTEQQRKAFVQKVAAARHSRQLVFRLLAPVAAGESSRNAEVLSPMMDDLLPILRSAGANNQEIGKTAETIEAWVKGQFPTTPTSAEAARFLHEEQHLWTLFQIIRCWSDRHRFVLALTAFDEAIRALTLQLPGKKTRRRNREADFAQVLYLIIKKVPAHPALIAPLLETLFVFRSGASLSRDIQRQLDEALAGNARLFSRLAAAERERDEEIKAKQDAEQRESQLRADLEATNTQLSANSEALRLQAGAHHSEKTGAVANAIADIRRKALPSLENIRLYADREAPNKEAILRTVQELEAYLTNFKHE